MTRRTVSLTFLIPSLLIGVGQIRAGQTAFLVDNFANSSSLRAWQFSNGAEFPGASGSLSLGPGHTGAGATLNFKIRCAGDNQSCGHYVGAYRNISTPPNSEFHAVSLWALFPVGMRLVLRVEDETGQTLQYSANTPTLEHQQANAWSPVLISLDDAPDGYWGGADNGRVSGAITQIGILADSKYPLPSQGTASFDDVWLLPSSTGVFDLGVNDPILPLPAAALPLSSRLGVNIHDLDDDLALDAARSAGFSFVRTDLIWATVEQNGQYNFSNYDGLLSALETRGMGVLWILDYGHPDHGGAQPRTAADIAAYGRYARAAAMHFKGHNVKYEIWNEPNLTQFLPDPSVYSQLLNSAVNAIREVDSSASVSTGGVSGMDLGFLATVGLSGAARNATAVGVHPYRSTVPETLAGDLILLNQLVDTSFRAGMPVWDTEWGYSSCGLVAGSGYADGASDQARKRQAVLSARQLLTAWTLGMPVAVWYDLRDDGNNPSDVESNFGLLDQSGNDKTAIRAVRTLTTAASDAIAAGLIANPPAGVHAMKLESNTRVTFIIWCDTPGAATQVQFPAANLESVNDMIGQPLSATASADGTATITVGESDGPVYLRFSRPATSPGLSSGAVNAPASAHAPSPAHAFAGTSQPPPSISDRLPTRIERRMSARFEDF